MLPPNLKPGSIRYLYRKARKPVWVSSQDKNYIRPAHVAMRMAKTQIEDEIIIWKFKEAKGYTLNWNDDIPDDAQYIIQQTPDNEYSLNSPFYSWNSLSGGSLCPIAYSEIHANKLRKEENKQKERAQEYGVWSYTAMVRDEVGNFESIDEVCGFIGDDFFESGYDIDLMNQCLKHHRENHPAKGMTLTELMMEFDDA